MVSTRKYNRVATEDSDRSAIAQLQQQHESNDGNARNRSNNSGSSNGNGNGNGENGDDDGNDLDEMASEMESKIQEIQDQQAFERNKYISQRLLQGVLALTILIYTIILIVING